MLSSQRAFRIGPTRPPAGFLGDTPNPGGPQCRACTLRSGRDGRIYLRPTAVGETGVR